MRKCGWLDNLIPILAVLVYSIKAHEGLPNESELWINLNDRLNSA